MKLSPWMNLKQDGEEAVIDIDGYIGFDFFKWLDDERQNTKEAMKKELKQIANIEASKITVNINSYGGDVNHGLSIHDLLASHKAQVTTNVTGMTASAATIIAQAGNERKISDNALYLAHICWGFAIGNVYDFEEALKDQKAVNDRIVNLYAKRSGKEESEIWDVMNESNGRGIWLSASEALEKGFVDEIYEPMELAACADTKLLSRFNYPVIPENKIPKIEDIKEKKENAMLDKIMEALKNSGLKDEAEEKDVLSFIEDGFKKVSELAAAQEQNKALQTELDVLKNGSQALTEKIETLESELKNEVEKREKLLGGNQAPENDNELSGKQAFFKLVDTIMDEKGLNREKATIAARRENPALFSEMIKSRQAKN